MPDKYRTLIANGCYQARIKKVQTYDAVKVTFSFAVKNFPFVLSCTHILSGTALAAQLQPFAPRVQKNPFIRSLFAGLGCAADALGFLRPDGGQPWADENLAVF